MDVLGDLVARDRRSEDPLVRFGDGPSKAYTAHKFCTDAWKASSLFRYNGVGPGRTVAIADDPRPQPLLALFAAALLGAPARFCHPGDVDARLLVADAADVDAWTLPPGGKRVAYAGPPDDPSVAHFERDIWSENPTMPPDGPATDDTALTTDGDAFTHADLLSAAEAVASDRDLTGEDAVALRASLTHPGTVVAGVLAPLSVGATVLLPEADATGTLAVADGDAPEPDVVAPADAL